MFKTDGSIELNENDRKIIPSMKMSHKIRRYALVPKTGIILEPFKFDIKVELKDFEEFEFKAIEAGYCVYDLLRYLMKAVNEGKVVVNPVRMTGS